MELGPTSCTGRQGGTRGTWGQADRRRGAATAYLDQWARLPGQSSPPSQETYKVQQCWNEPSDSTVQSLCTEKYPCYDIKLSLFEKQNILVRIATLPCLDYKVIESILFGIAKQPCPNNKEHNFVMTAKYLCSES